MSFIHYLRSMKVREVITMNTKTLDQIKDKYYGPVGTPERERLENELEALRIGFFLNNDNTDAVCAEVLSCHRNFRE